MNICIICSLKCEDECKKTKDVLINMGFDVVTPFDNQHGSLFNIQLNYLHRIGQADIVLAIPKEIDAQGQDWVSVFGESTTYELAYAIHIGKPVIFGVLPFIGGDWK